ncbi:hypothetical protein ACJ41O_005118 [Fusarium nematophilum]
MSGLVNKIKDAIHSDKPTEQPEGTSGPHSSRVGNTADPRVDSDRDHRAAHTSGLAGTGEYSSGGQYTTESRNTYGTEGPASRTDGPHKSNALNKADPRVDSDRDHSRNLGANPHGTSGTGAYDATDSSRTGGLGGTTGGLGGTAGGLGGTTGGLGGTTGGLGGTTGGLGGTGTSGFGSRDTSGLTDNSRTTGAGAGTTGFSSTGTGAYGSTGSSGLPEGTTGPHSSRAANAADPRVDSDLDNSRNLGARGGAGTTGFPSSGTTGTYGETTTGRTGGSGLGGTGTGTHGASSYGTTGPAPGTAGPHKSDVLNKADPRVDSNLDGSKTIGRDKTFEQSNDFAGRDPTDATQVPPSVMQKHIGAPEVAHDHHDAEHSRRHSVSHQERHRGLQPSPVGKTPAVALILVHHALAIMSSPIPQALWSARIPLHITHPASPTTPFITSIPRFSYLALLLPRLSSFFDSPCSSFHFEEVQLRNLAVGLLVDLYQPSLPWRLTVNGGVGWDIADTFLNCVKEADFIRNGNANQIMKMSKDHTTQLWNAVIDNDHHSFNRINSRLLNAPTALKHVPIRIYIPTTTAAAPDASTPSPSDHGTFKVVQSLMPASSPDRRPKLLGQALRDLLPGLFPSSRDPILAKVVMHGAGVPFEAPLEELMREAAYPDGWLCLVVVVL